MYKNSYATGLQRLFAANRASSFYYHIYTFKRKTTGKVNTWNRDIVLY